MNNLTSISHPQSEQQNSTLSLFKLPLVFTVMFIIIQTSVYFLLNILTYEFQLVDELSFLTESIIGNFSRYLTYFIIALFMLIHCKLHQINKHNLLFILITCIIFIMVNFFITQGLYSLFDFLSSPTYHDDFFYDDYAKIDNLNLFFPFFLSIFSFVLFALIIKLVSMISIFNKHPRPNYKLNSNQTQSLFAFLFSLIFSLIPLVIFSGIYYYTVDGLISIFGLNDFYAFVLFMTTTFFLTLIAYHFIIVFLAVINCFTRKFSEIPITLLIKSVAFAYFYLIIFNIIITVIDSLLLYLIDNKGYGNDAFVIVYLFVMIMFSFLINLIATILLTRKAVKKYFWDNEQVSE